MFVARSTPALNPRKKPRSSQLSGRPINHPATAPAAAAKTGRPHQGQACTVSAARAGSQGAVASQGARNFQQSQPPAKAKATRGNGGPCSLSCGRRKRAVNAGLNVRELKAEISVETA